MLQRGKVHVSNRQIRITRSGNTKSYRLVMFKSTVKTEIVRDNVNETTKRGERGRKNAREKRRRTECQLTVREKARENRHGARRTRKTRGTVTGKVRGDPNCDRPATPGELEIERSLSCSVLSAHSLQRAVEGKRPARGYYY